MKQNIPEKGAVVQRDGETFAIKVHMPGGFTNPEELRRVADVAERYGVPEIKITIAQRICLLGIPEEKLDAIRADLGDLEEGGVGLCVRYAKMCPGATWCKRAQRVTKDIGMEMDRRYHRLKVPWKFKMSVSGCPNDCSESFIRDLGLIGGPKGWKILVGGNGGSRPRMAQVLVEEVATDEEALAVVERLVSWLTAAEKKCRLGKVIEEMGIEAFRKEVL
jgi:NAD(P)H-nitrite reductase large subunit